LSNGICPPNRTSRDDGSFDLADTDEINFRKWLDRFTLEYGGRRGSTGSAQKRLGGHPRVGGQAGAQESVGSGNAANDAARGASRGGSVLETLYRSHAQLLTVFRFLDTNHDRKVSRDEFIAGFALLVGEAGEAGEAELSAELGDASDLFDAIDLDGSGQIELDEFCESFRISYDARRD